LAWDGLLDAEPFFDRSIDVASVVWDDNEDELGLHLDHFVYGVDVR